MAQRGVQLDRETFSCSICLDLLKDPVTIPCGHSYCMSCIKTHWDEEYSWKNHSCPQCRRSFTPRPELEKNTLLADLAEKLKKTGLPAAPADHCYAGPEDVACDVCSGRQRKAAKFCLRCLVSYCDEHLQPHYRSPAFKKHKLVEPSKNRQENICSPQDDMMEMLCCPDQTSVCYHRNDHDTAAERRERQKELEGSRQNIQQRIQDREKDVKLLQQEVEAINRSADKTVEDSEEMFTEVSRLRELQEKLQQEIRELQRRDAELEELSHTEDHTQLLQHHSSVSALRESTSSIERCEGATAAVSTEEDTEEGRGDKLQDEMREKLKNASLTEVDHQPEPRTRAEFLKYSYDLTLDPKTANHELLLSNGMRKASLKINHLFSLSGPERFSSCCQVLSKESLTGRCYWEVEWSGRGLLVAVAYKSISRTGSLNECAFGLNDKSWALKYEVLNYTFWHNSVQTPVSGPLGSRIGVYLDHRAGVLSFYSVSETRTLLHRVQTTFTQPLHAGLWLLYSYGATAEFCKLI